MLSIETENRVAKLFVNLADREREVELNRQILAQNLDFDAYQAFTVLDKEGKNGIDAVNIVDFLRRNGVYANLTETNFIIQFYDENNDNQLSYTEFLNLVLSENNFALRRLARERVGSSYPRENLPFNVEYSIVKLFEKELELVRSTLSLLDDAKMRFDFNVHSIFHLVQCSSSITSMSMRSFLTRSGASFTDDDIRSIIKRLDINRDSQVDFCEFHAFFSYPDCCKCCSCRHACKCCCVMSCSGCRSCLSNGNNISTNMTSSLMTTNARLSPLRRSYDNNENGNTNQFNTSNDNFRSMSPEMRRISPNLSLRLSPERRFSPRNSPRNSPLRQSPLRSSNNNINSIRVSNSPMRSTSPLTGDSRLELRASPVRRYSPRRTYSPRYTSPRRTCSPIRSYSPHCCHQCRCAPCRCCLMCHCNPCRCCQLQYENAQNSFISFLKEVMNVENQIEKAKIDLALRSDFNVEDAYRIFELDGRGIVTEADLKYGLSQLDIFATSNDIKLLMKRADVRRSGSITYEDFFDLVTPFEKDYRTMVENRLPSTFSPQYNKADVFLLSTKIYLQNLLRLIISSESKLEAMRLGLDNVRNNIRCIYGEIDRTGLGVISDLDLSAYLKKNGVFCSDRESGLAFIRFDRNRNGKVELWEIIDEVSVC